MSADGARLTEAATRALATADCAERDARKNAKKGGPKRDTLAEVSARVARRDAADARRSPAGLARSLARDAGLPLNAGVAHAPATRTDAHGGTGVHASAKRWPQVAKKGGIKNRLALQNIHQTIRPRGSILQCGQGPEVLAFTGPGTRRERLTAHLR